MTTTYKYCFCFRRKFRSTSTDPPKSVVEVFRRYTDGSLMGPDQMLRFLVDVQGERDATRELAQEIIDNALINYRYLNMIYRKGGLSVEEFYRYLFSDANSLVSEKPMVHQDMHAPMSHYFIYTGHNSYLTGNQLSSDCSDVPIIKALKRGVRVIELDLWPNSSKTDVHVCHGRTLTTPVELIKCLRSIKEHAFSASPYPLIITLEDHLTPHLQAKVAEMLHQTFGDMLFVPKSLEEFPSPVDLKMRIIISTKPPKEYLEAKKENPKFHGVMRRKDSADEGEWGSELPDFSTDIIVENKDELDEGEDHPEEGDTEEAQLNAAPEYKQLIAVTARNIKGGFKEAFKIEPDKISRLSMSEQVFEKAVIRHGTEIVRFTQKNMLRIYPKGTRIRSSNYNPLLGWMHGAQLVAFNMQGYGRSLWLMHGMFRANGGCGYVKKPDILLSNSPFNPRMNLPVEKVLKVRVFMGDGWHFDFSRTHFDAYSPPDFYMRVGIAGVPSDTIMKKTRVIEDNWTPIWEEEFTFPLSVPELALLRIEVHEYNMSEKDDFAGQTCLPISELRSGIRAVPLFDRKGVKLHSVKVLMQFQFLQTTTRISI